MIVMNILTYGQALRVIEAHTSPAIASALLEKANEDGSVQTNEAHGNLIIKRTPGGYLVRPAR